VGDSRCSAAGRKRFSLIALEAAGSSDNHGVVMTRGPEGRVRIGVGKDMAPS
jgi:hypothetical protein